MMDEPSSQATSITQFTVEAEDIKPRIIPFRYDTLPGNQPKTNKNTVYLWQTKGEDVLVKITPFRSQSISRNEPNASTNFTGLSLSKEPYLMAYAVDDNVKAIVATLLIEGVGDGRFSVSFPTDNLSFSVTQIGPASLSYRLCVPRGMNPKDDNDWIGLWEGSTVSELYYKRPRCFSPVPIHTNKGNGVFALLEGQNIENGIEYTLGYFKSGYDEQNPLQTTLAASTTFKWEGSE
jgi:hypothetical protein